mgnify:CR=1 FL=1
MQANATHIRRQLDQLITDQATIENELATWTTRPSSHTRGADPAVGPLPGGTQILSTAADLGPGGHILATLATWEDDWRTLRDMAPRARPGTLEDVCRWLAVHTSWAVANHPAIDEFQSELDDVARDVRRAIADNDRWARTRINCWAPAPGASHDSGTTRVDRIVPAATCSAPLWIDRLDPAYPLLVCKGCGSQWTPEGIGDLRTMPIALHDAAALTGLTVKALRHAVDRALIPNQPEGRRVRIRLADVWRWRLSA